jgi:hypothetical protein
MVVATMFVFVTVGIIVVVIVIAVPVAIIDNNVVHSPHHSLHCRSSPCFLRDVVAVSAA